MTQRPPAPLDQARQLMAGAWRLTPYRNLHVPNGPWQPGLALHQGPVRDRNEDYALVFQIDDMTVAILADGCGGIPLGQQAAFSAVNGAAVSVIRHLVNADEVGGLSNLIANANLSPLFRWGVSIDPDQRPTAATWKQSLLRAVDEVYVCPRCGYPNLIDASKQRCPSCQELYPTLAIEIPGSTGAGLEPVPGVVPGVVPGGLYLSTALPVL